MRHREIFHPSARKPGARRSPRILDSDPQSEMDLHPSPRKTGAAWGPRELGQPKQNTIHFPVTLAERYQPRRIAEFIGLAACGGSRNFGKAIFQGLKPH
ncbi:MAG TPA: hypothetical protein VL240_05525 [Candidatus Binatia bacterium]|nr:hypothetical protein [Candidatus Binatia bacterium]